MQNSKIDGILKLIDSHQKLIAVIHATWCPHCTDLLPKWREMVEEHDDFNHNVVDIEQSEFTGNIESRIGSVKGFPTIISVDENGHRSEYQGSRDKDSIAKWVSSELNNPEELPEHKAVPEHKAMRKAVPEHKAMRKATRKASRKASQERKKKRRRSQRQKSQRAKSQRQKSQRAKSQRQKSQRAKSQRQKSQRQKKQKGGYTYGSEVKKNKSEPNPKKRTGTGTGTGARIKSN